MSTPEKKPANRATATKAVVNENIQMLNASTRGITRYRKGSTPWASSMWTWPSVFMVPSSTSRVEPLRPITIRPTNTGAISRTSIADKNPPNNWVLPKTVSQ